jgi:uncharacterized protein YgiM (DUF1202 family)
MKRITAWATLGMASLAATAGAQTMQVEVRSAKLTEEPRSLSRVVAEVKHGDRVQVQQKQKDWWNVRLDDGTAGWITRRSLAKEGTTMTLGDVEGRTGVSEDEQALAYRPWSPEVERAYRGGNSATAQGYATLDRIEQDPTYKVSDTQRIRFLKDGQVSPGGEP